MRRKRLAAAACAVALAGLSAGPALGGEITGSGKWIAGSEDAPPHGMSECAFSGQNDEYILGDTSALRSQSWGQIARSAQGALGGVPGTACNPTRATGGE
jgi:hypothetical protein